MSNMPASIGKYRIKRMLGEGAMGQVFEGEDEAIERRVAIKTLHTHLVNNKNGHEFLERFKREARSAARCTHPNIVTILEYGEDKDMPFIAMEYIDGFSLHDLLQARKKISLKNVLKIISQMLKAIHAAHKLGVIHRDIKTANIIINKEDNNVKLADFGIARFNDANSMTMTGAVVGTPRYMAPEQMFGLKVDERADLFSIAMVFIELLGALQPEPVYPSSRITPIEGLPPNNKINYAMSYPDALIPVLRKGLASKAAERFQNARQFAEALKAALPHLKRASGGAAATLVVNGQDTGESIISEELDTLTSMLTSYIGPVARNVMRDVSTRHSTLQDLVSAVSAEIPDADQRKSFLRDWESQSGQRSLSGSSLGNTQPGSTQSTRGSRIRVDENTIQRIGQDYINYIGPFAMRLVDHYCQESSDKEEFIQNLASEIPDQKLRDEFTKKWSIV
jgi:serine/threonine protein kinase